MIRSVVCGTGAYLPSRVVSNKDLEKLVETSDQWIFERTGIRERRVAAEGELTSDLAVKAAENALAAAGLTAGDIDLIVLATSTPDHTFPATATKVQARLGITGGAAFDIQAVCSGFLFALATADNFLKAGQFKRALVIGAETFSRILDWQDRRTCVLFGDGAGALVLEAQEGAGDNSDRGVLMACLHSDGRYYDKLCVNGGVSSTQTAGTLQMEGREVFRHAVTNLVDVMRESLEAAGLTAEDIDWVIPHQANRRIIEATTRKFGIAECKVVMTIERHGNTSAASVPLALCEAVTDGRVKTGDLVLLEAMGGGFTWGSVILRW